MDEYVPIPGSKIKIVIEGLRNPTSKDPTDSFSVSSFNQDSNQFYYYIDKVDTGLRIEGKCNYPCQTCKEDDPDHCLSCYPDNG